MLKRYLVLYNCEGKYYCKVYLCNSQKQLLILINKKLHNVKNRKLFFVEKFWFINSKGILIEQPIINSPNDI